MPGIFAVKLEQPDLTAPSGWNGLVSQVYDCTVTRHTNAAGSFTVSFPLAANEATSVKRGWRVTVLQERIGAAKSDGSAFTPPALVYRGRVTRRTVVVDEAGGTTLQLEGETSLGVLADRLVHATKTYTSQTLNAILTDLITPLGISWSTPGRCATETVSVEISDLTYLQALLRLTELTRTNLVDQFDGSIAFTDQNNIPDPTTNVNVDEPTVRVVNVERATPDTVNAAFQGFAVVASTPSLTYNADQLANRIKVIGVDHDGTPLTLQDATAPFGSNYAVQSAAAPTGTYYFLEDSASVTAYGRVEVQLVRSDIRNPTDSSVTRAMAKSALFAIAEGELLRRRAEVTTFQCQLANGEDVYVLPGEKVYLRYAGQARLADRTVVTVTIDRYMLVARRYDRAGSGGTRLVSLDLVTPEFTYVSPDLPNVTSIPTPKDGQMPVEKPPEDPALDNPPPTDDYGPDPGQLQNALDNMRSSGAYQNCCADSGFATRFQTGDAPPFPTRYCVNPVVSHADGDIHIIRNDVNVNKERGLLVLGDAAGDVACLPATGCVAHLLHAWDSPIPANFGGDGHFWWRVFYIEPTSSTVDISGSTGSLEVLQWFTFRDNLPSGHGTYGDGVDVNMLQDLQYVATFGTAIATSTVSQSTIFGDLMFQFMQQQVRTIDDITYAVHFHHQDPTVFNHDASYHNVDPLPTDWMLEDTKNDAFLPHVITMTNTATAVASSFPGACRILTTQLSARLRGLCPIALLA